ncbi:hypothetical protein BGW39_009965 [Mortierella sp. 14UC]|nr:hypothetical protein BGW39_009965 [Mortierella sp. 14UC]
MATSADMSSLPLEIIINALSPHLTKHDLTNCVCVNKRWHNIFTPLLWESISFVNTQEVEAGIVWMVDLAKITRFRRFERSAIEAGALHKNGRWIRKVDAGFCGMLDLLTGTTDGGGARAGEEVVCDALMELEIGDDRSSDIYMNPANQLPKSQPQDVHVTSVVTLLQRPQGRLRKLTFLDTLLRNNAENSVRMIRAIPSSVEDLSISDWSVSLSTSSAFSSESKEPLLSSLKTLSVTRSNVDNILLVLKRSPMLETLTLKDWFYPTSDRPPWYLLATTIREFCPRLTSLLLVDCPPYSDDEFAELLGASASGWKTLGFPRRYDAYGYGNDAHKFGPLSVEALLKHCATIENLRLEGCSEFPSWAIQEVLCSSTRLRRLDAISKERYRGRNVQLDAGDVVDVRASRGRGKREWACLSLESLKIHITGIPRGGVSSNNTKTSRTGTIGQEQDIQRQIYKQLGRMTQLKQLVLGHELKNPRTIYQPEEGASLEGTHPFGVPYEERPLFSAGYQDSCLEMTLASGLGLLEGLKELRFIETGGMAVGVEGDEEVEWRKKFWPLLQSREEEEGGGKERRWMDAFWVRFGYKEYY